MPRRGLWIYAAIAAGWALVLAWQSMEHVRVRESARLALISRARDITSTLGLVIRSQRRWGGLISKDRLESVLQELLRPGELRSIALLNAEGDIVASAGSPLPGDHSRQLASAVTWSADTLTLANLIDLGTPAPQQQENEQPRSTPTIVVSPNNFPPPPGASPFTNAPPRPPRTPPQNNQDTERLRDGDRRDNDRRDDENRGERTRRGRPPGRPFWMSETEYKALIAKQGVHSIGIVMPTTSLHATTQQDLWMRFVIALLATATAAGTAFIWRNLHHASDLELRLVKASEMNSHLRQMNLAAAGLAHETRNPLNIIRGLAQLISRESQAPQEVRERSSAIVNEADRVTAQLNEFINYSRPREVRPAAIHIAHVTQEVARALAYDTEEKHITLTVPTEDLVIEADEQLLRQALFNLLLNAIQAVDDGGAISVSIRRTNGQDAALEVADNGPGVPPDRRTEIFKPYFTTQEKGTGLGLAVVRQIVAAHGWEIDCLDNPPRGAVFRIQRIKVLTRS